MEKRNVKVIYLRKQFGEVRGGGGGGLGRIVKALWCTEHEVCFFIVQM